MATKNLSNRLARLEQSANAKSHAEVDEEAMSVCRDRLQALHRRRTDLLEARKRLPLEQQLALARQDRDARAARGELSISEPMYRWGRELVVRGLEIEILARDALVVPEVLDGLREGCRKLLMPFLPLPVRIDVLPILDEEMRQLERELDECAARIREMRGAAQQ